jgi:hypothetical protein
MAFIQDESGLFIQGLGDNIVEDLWGTDDDGKLDLTNTYRGMRKRDNIPQRRELQLKHAP